jgi:hypothetical protein
MNTKPQEVRQLPASTFAEILIVILVTGVVLAAVMDGLELFGRYASGLASRIVESGRMRESYYLLDHQVTSADSVTESEGHITAWRSGMEAAVLYQRDSMLLVVAHKSPDTLFTGVASFGIVRAGNTLVETDSGWDMIAPDSAALMLLRDGRIVNISIPVIIPDYIAAQQNIQQTEQGYAYE